MLRRLVRVVEYRQREEVSREHAWLIEAALELLASIVTARRELVLVVRITLDLFVLLGLLLFFGLLGWLSAVRICSHGGQVGALRVIGTFDREDGVALRDEQLLLVHIAKHFFDVVAAEWGFGEAASCIERFLHDILADVSQISQCIRGVELWQRALVHFSDGTGTEARS